MISIHISVLVLYLIFFFAALDTRRPVSLQPSTPSLVPMTHTLPISLPFSSCWFLISSLSSLDSSQNHLYTQQLASTMLWMSCSHLKFSMCKLSPSFPTLHKSGPPFVFSLIIALFGFQITHLQVVLDAVLYPQIPPDSSTSSLFVERTSPISALVLTLSICTLMVIITTSVIRILGYKKWKLIPAIISRRNLFRVYWVVHTSTERLFTHPLKIHQEMQWRHTLELPGKELTMAFSSSVFFTSVTDGTSDVAEIWSSWTFKNPRHKPSDSSMLDCVPTPCCSWERELLVPAFVVGERPDSYQHLQNEGFSEKGRESDWITKTTTNIDHSTELLRPTLVLPFYLLPCSLNKCCFLCWDHSLAAPQGGLVATCTPFGVDALSESSPKPLYSPQLHHVSFVTVISFLYLCLYFIMSFLTARFVLFFLNLWCLT